MMSRNEICIDFEFLGWEYKTRWFSIVEQEQGVSAGLFHVKAWFKERGLDTDRDRDRPSLTVVD